MPADFAVAEYEAIGDRIRPKSTLAAWRLWAGGWNGLENRFRSCAESDEAFTASIRQGGGGPPPPERYVQERELFSFFVAGLASVESLCFGLFAIGSLLRPSDYPTATPEDLRRISPESTARAFGTFFPGDALALALQSFTASQEFRDWKEIRNVLAHRSAPGRRIFSGTQQAAEWWGGIPLDQNTTTSRRHWLSGQISAILGAARSFTEREF